MSQTCSFTDIFDDMYYNSDYLTAENTAGYVDSFVEKYKDYILEITNIANTHFPEAAKKEAYFTMFADALIEHFKQMTDACPKDHYDELEYMENYIEDTFFYLFLPVVTYLKLPDCILLGRIFEKSFSDYQSKEDTIDLFNVSEFFDMYDDMFSRINDFKQKTYDDIFNSFVKIYGNRLQRAVDKAKAFGVEATFHDYALALTDHVKGMIESYPVKKREKIAIDHNVTMVAYFLPVITYSKDPAFMQLGETFVRVWNESKTTGNELHLSTYEAIASGFKKSIFCYITTAVCGTLNKPDDCYELTLLRDYRDHYLARTEDGKNLINEYYNIAPRLVLSINICNTSDDIYRALYSRYILPCIDDIENDEMEACKERYINMVRSLESQFIAS